MSEDTISRQAVIEINRSYHGQMPNEVNHRIWKEINELPSAQPETHEERTETHACDCISRQAAIEAMEDVDWYHINKDGQLTHGANSKEDEPLYKAEDVYKVLNDMPSAQPELYGYKIEHLALIARVMQKEGVSPEDAVRAFNDIQRICGMVIDEVTEIIQRETKVWMI